jgi:hypothetical protein
VETQTEEGERLTEEGERLTEEGERLTEEGERLTEEGERLTEEEERLTEEEERRAEAVESELLSPSVVCVSTDHDCRAAISVCGDRGGGSVNLLSQCLHRLHIIRHHPLK